VPPSPPPPSDPPRQTHSTDLPGQIEVRRQRLAVAVEPRGEQIADRRLRHRALHEPVVEEIAEDVAEEVGRPVEHRGALELRAGREASAPSSAALPREVLERDLGRGLAYLRVTQLPADLPTKTAEPRHALVLDLRFASADATDGKAFAAWLKFRANTSAPLTILVNPGTSPLLLRAFLASPLPPGVVTIGPAASEYTVDIPVTVSPQADRLAYDALANGTTIADLIAHKLDKPRRDEAQLARQHTNGGTDEDSDEPSPKPATTPAPPVVEVPVTDLVLIRAVQLHRALLALRRLP
jgi:hypothetical protein